MVNRTFAATALLALSLIACGGSSGNNANSSAHGAPVEVGVISELTGAVADLGIEYSNGTKLAEAQINASGGIKSLGNRPIHLNLTDDASTTAPAHDNAVKLIDSNKVVAILGPSASSPCLAAAPVVEQKQIPAICRGTADQIVTSGFRYMFDSGILGSTYVKRLFPFIDALNQSSGGTPIKKLAVLYEDGAYGTNINNQAGSLAQGAGYDLVARLPYHAGTPDLSSLVNRANGAGAQLIVNAGFIADSINIVRAIRTLNLKIGMVSFAGGVVGPSMLNLGGPANGVLAISDWNSDLKRPGMAKYLADYKKMFGHDPAANAGYGYTDTYTLKEALETAGSTDPNKIRDALLKINITSGPAVDMQAYSVRFTSNGMEANQDQMSLGLQVQNGQFVTIWPSNVAAGKYDPSTLK